MSSQGDVIFIMRDFDLVNGTPKMKVEYGLIFIEEKEFKLISK